MKGHTVNPLCEREYCSRPQLNVQLPDTAVLCPRKARIMQEPFSGNRKNTKSGPWWNYREQ